MIKRTIILVIGIWFFSLIVGFMWFRAQTRLGSEVSITFIGFTNNSGAMPAVTDKILAVFSVTNRASSSVEPTFFYYIQTPGSWESYAPLGLGGTIVPHGSTTILTRIPTNGAPWRVIVPYARTTVPAQVARELGDRLDRALNHPLYGFDRYGRGAATSDWIKR